VGDIGAGNIYAGDKLPLYQKIIVGVKNGLVFVSDA
jgi:hypothetical protein